MAQAVVKWLQKRQFVGIDSSRHAVVVSAQDEQNAVGCRPSELLLVSLGACSAVDIVDILEKKRMPLAALEIEVRGEPDPGPDYPRPFRKIHMLYRLRGAGLTPEAAEQAIRLSEEKYCMVAATLGGVAEITWEYEIQPEPE